MENKHTVTSPTSHAAFRGLLMKRDMSIPKTILMPTCRHWTWVFSACLFLILSGTVAAASVVVSTANGPVEGTLEDGLHVFRGIPYAASPEGDLRWKPPQLPAPYDGTFEASAFGAQCPQFGPSGIVGDEDCLFLNVWAPKGAAGLPVMVWIHGGGHINGSGDGGISFDGNPLYDG